MEIKKVVTDKFYKNQYINFGGNIFEINYFKAMNPSLIGALEEVEAILKNSKDNLKAAKFIEKITFKPFPSNKKMIETINKKCESICDFLQLNEIKGEDAKIVKSLVLFNYLSKNTRYNMTVQESIDIDNFEKIINKMENKLIKLKEEHQNLEILKNLMEDKNDKKILSAQIEHVKKDFISLSNQSNKCRIEFLNEFYIKAIYSALIYNQGVCSGFSYTYQLLLKTAGINAFSLEAYKEGEATGHAFNLLEFKQGNKTTYHIADVTSAIAQGSKDSKTILKSFSIPKEKYFYMINQNVATIKKLSSLKKDSRTTFFENIYTSTLCGLIYNKINNKEVLEKQKLKALIFIDKHSKIKEQILNDEIIK